MADRIGLITGFQLFYNFEHQKPIGYDVNCNKAAGKFDCQCNGSANCIYIATISDPLPQP